MLLFGCYFGSRRALLSRLRFRLPPWLALRLRLRLPPSCYFGFRWRKGLILSTFLWDAPLMMRGMFTIRHCKLKGICFVKRFFFSTFLARLGVEYVGLWGFLFFWSVFLVFQQFSTRARLSYFLLTLFSSKTQNNSHFQSVRDGVYFFFNLFSRRGFLKIMKQKQTSKASSKSIASNNLQLTRFFLPFESSTLPSPPKIQKNRKMPFSRTLGRALLFFN